MFFKMLIKILLYVGFGSYAVGFVLSWIPRFILGNSFLSLYIQKRIYFVVGLFIVIMILVSVDFWAKGL